MTFTLLLLLLGTLLVYGGWTNRSILSLLRGDNTLSQNNPVPK